MKRGGKAYNTNVIVDRNGNVVGKQDKIYLAEGEEKLGITPGEKPLVFNTEFGKIGMITGLDIVNSVQNEQADMGAEIIFAASTGDFTHLAKQAAKDLGVWMIFAGQDVNRNLAEEQQFDKSAIIDPGGNIVKSVTDGSCIRNAYNSEDGSYVNYIVEK